MLNSQQRLKSVSRSMYLSFAILPRVLREPMGVAYMLCRAADTLADGTSLPVDERRRYLDRFRGLFDIFPFDVAHGAEFCSEINGLQFTDVRADQLLLNQLPACFHWHTALSLTDQTLVAKVVTGVIRGMEQDLAVFPEEESTGLRSFATSEQLESYLQWIGGEPGRFWSEICLAHVPNLPREARWLHHGITFGTGLQLVNVLRDLPADLKRGRCYIPDELLKKHGLSLESLVPPKLPDDPNPKELRTPSPVSHLVEDRFRTLYVDLIGQADYLAGVPGSKWGLRAAVIWPLLIGLETLKRLQEAPTILNSRQRIKVSRNEIYHLLATTALWIPFQKWIERKARSIN